MNTSKSSFWLLAIGLLVLPILAKGLWYYRGIYQPTSTIQVPAYEDIQAPIMPVDESEVIEHIGIESQDAILNKILVDVSHDNNFDLPELEPFFQAIHARGVGVEFLETNLDFNAPPLEERLKSSIAYISVAPMRAFSSQEMQALQDFNKRGGRILVITDPTRSGYNLDPYYSMGDEGSIGVVAANQLLNAHDLVVSNDYLYNLVENEGNFRNPVFRNFSEHEITTGLKDVILYATHSVTTQAGTPLFKGDENTFSSLTDSPNSHSPAAISEDETVLAIGDLTFLTSPYHQVADNPTFINRVVDFLINSKRIAGLEDFPHVFQRPIIVITHEEFPLSAETVELFTSIQRTFQPLGQNVRTAAKPRSEEDILLHAPYTGEASIDKFLKESGLSLPLDPGENTLKVDGFGEIKLSGIGLVVYTQEPDRNSLLLLAEDTQSLIKLAEVVFSNGLEECAFHSNLAVCKIGEGEGFDGMDSSSEYEFDEEFYLEDAVPTHEP